MKTDLIKDMKKKYKDYRIDDKIDEIVNNLFKSDIDFSKINKNYKKPIKKMEIEDDPINYDKCMARRINGGYGENSGTTYASISAVITQAHSSTLKGKLDFRTSEGDSNQIRMTIADTGYVGIGTVTPADPLHVYSNGGSTINFDTNGASNWRVGATTTGGGYSTPSTPAPATPSTPAPSTPSTPSGGGGGGYGGY